MDKRYVILFKDLAQATAATAEQVMEYESQQNNEKGMTDATTMRNNFQNIADKIVEENYTMSKIDAANLLIGALIQTNQLQTRIDTLKKAMTGYQTDIIPKLEQIVDAKEDEDVTKKANELFVIEETN